MCHPHARKGRGPWRLDSSETNAKTFAVRVQEMLDSLGIDLAAMIRDVRPATRNPRQNSADLHKSVA